MNTFFRILLRTMIAAGWTAILSAAPVPCAAEETGIEAGRIDALVRRLGARDFGERDEAEKELKSLPRAAVPILKRFENDDDPEVRLRLRGILDAILLDPGRIPTAVYVFDEQPATAAERKNRWMVSRDEWWKSVSMAASHTNGEAGMSQSFDQSFVPHTDTIRGVDLGVYPASFDLGWIRLDLRADEGGNPGPVVLARGWIRFDKTCPVPHGTWTPFVLPEVTVKPDATHWLCFTEYPDGEHRAIVNVRVSLDGRYSEGAMRPKDSTADHPQQDAQFRILSRCGPPPGMRPATDGERRTLPVVERPPPESPGSRK